MSYKECSRVHIPFRWLLTFLVVGSVLLVSAALTYVSIDGMQRLTEKRAKVTFTALAEQDALQIEALVGNAASTVEDNAHLPTQILKDERGLNTALLVERLIADLRPNPGFYGAFLGLSTGESLRVLALRKDPLKEKLLGAPTGTFWAVQHIVADEGGQASARWQFWDEFRTTVSYSDSGTLYSARERPWWKKSQENPGLQITGPYFFLEAHELGMTFSNSMANGEAVIGMAVSLKSINDTLAHSLRSHDGGIIVMDRDGKVIGAHASEAFSQPSLAALEPASASTNPFYSAAAKMLEPGRESTELVETDAGSFVYVRRDVKFANTETLHIVAFSPLSAYSALMLAARTDLIVLTLALLALMVPLAWLAALRLTRPLEVLTAESARIQAMDFSERDSVHSRIAEIDTLDSAHRLMRTALRERTESLNKALGKLEKLAEAGIQLTTEHKEDPLLHKVVTHAIELLDAQSGQYWRYKEDSGFSLVAWSAQREDAEAIHPTSLLGNDSFSLTLRPPQSIRIDANSLPNLDPALQQCLAQQSTESLLAVPIMLGPRLAGLLVLCNALDATGAPTAFTAAQEHYALTLAAQTGVSLQNMELQRAQGSMMDSLIQVIASAIDAKSAYTGGHCNRVPELALLLLEAANKQKQGPLADFAMEGEDELREFRIGAWLHDCGKVTTPEAVVDKATKLETIYNRIHEVRMRFEVLQRDAQIARLQAIANGADAAVETQRCNDRLAQLQDDFAFIASCNVGGEFMPAEDVQRLRDISEQTWWRHFDDRLGLSHIELNNIQDIAVQPLPACEPLLADKAEHVTVRTEAQHYSEHYGFKVTVPENMANLGELHNLSIQRGTLNPEERFKINEHIMQTIVMLEQLPLPDTLARVPEYAGTHHETMRGTGYPRGLDGTQLSIPARIMAVADIFEALTASDRPYKKGKTLSDSIKILSFFRDDGHIDPDIFDLLLSSGVYLQYAQLYLDASQIDSVDVQHYLNPPEKAGAD